MRLADLIRENATSKDAVLDLLTAMAGEGLDSIPLETLSDELSHQGIDLDENALFDLLGSLAIVRNIKDGVAFFNTDSDQSHNATDLPDPGVQKNQVKKLAKKQVDKGMKK
tara:strand:- start:3327 stop:3659 length:333 start_codon:yes stop_codon:yes gene_type:complete